MAGQRAALLLLALCMLIWLFVLQGRHSGVSPAVTAFSHAAEPFGWVQVTGAVRHAGAYPLFDKMVTDDVIKMAEPLCPIIIAAERPVDLTVYGRGVQIRMVCLPSLLKGRIEVRPLAPAPRLVLGIPLQLNRSSAEELDLVPGLGPVLAGRIVRYRQNNGDFKNINELLQVEGIGLKKLESLRKYLTC